MIGDWGVGSREYIVFFLTEIVIGFFESVLNSFRLDGENNRNGIGNGLIIMI